MPDGCKEEKSFATSNDMDSDKTATIVQTVMMCCC